jgi:hypothetical protein
MELLIIVALLVALALLAMRFGADSRDRTRAGEEDFAALGLAWDGSPTGERPANGRPTPTVARPRASGRPAWQPALRER